MTMPVQDRPWWSNMPVHDRAKPSGAPAARAATSQQSGLAAARPDPQPDRIPPLLRSPAASTQAPPRVSPLRSPAYTPPQVASASSPVASTSPPLDSLIKLPSAGEVGREIVDGFMGWLDGEVERAEKLSASSQIATTINDGGNDDGVDDATTAVFEGESCGGDCPQVEEVAGDVSSRLLEGSARRPCRCREETGSCGPLQEPVRAGGAGVERRPRACGRDVLAEDRLKAGAKIRHGQRMSGDVIDSSIQIEQAMSSDVIDSSIPSSGDAIVAEDGTRDPAEQELGWAHGAVVERESARAHDAVVEREQSARAHDAVVEQEESAPGRTATRLSQGTLLHRGQFYAMSGEVIDITIQIDDGRTSSPSPSDRCPTVKDWKCALAHQWFLAPSFRWIILVEDGEILDNSATLVFLRPQRRCYSGAIMWSSTGRQLQLLVALENFQRVGWGRGLCNAMLCRRGDATSYSQGTSLKQTVPVERVVFPYSQRSKNKRSQ